MYFYEMIEKIGVISEYVGDSGEDETKEVNIVQWFQNRPSVDIRRWQDDKPLKGINIRPDEIDELIHLLEVAKSKIT